MRYQLRETNVAGFPTFPIVDTDGGTAVRLLFIVGGLSRDGGKIRATDGGDVHAELPTFSGAVLEPQQRPDNGPLPVYGGFSLQSVAVFRFAAASEPTRRVGGPARRYEGGLSL